MRNIGIKILSLFIAIIIWVGVASEKRTQGEIILAVPIEVKNIPSNVELVSFSPSIVNIRLKGPLSAIKSMTPSDVSIVIDVGENIPELDKIKEISTFNIKLEITMIKTLPSVKVEDILPPTIEIKLERKIKKRLKILKTDISIKPKENYKIESIQLEPEHITVEGPISVMQGRNTIKAEPIIEINIVQSFERYINIKKFNSRVSFINDDNKVLLKVKVKKIKKGDKNK